MKNPSLSIEDRFILSYQVNLSSKEKSRDKPVFLNPDWEKILKISEQHGVQPLLYHNVCGINIQNIIPVRILLILKNSYYCNIARNTALLEEFISVTKSAEKSGIKIIPLKGLALIGQIYKNHGLRAMADVDALVQENDIPKTKNILIENGYKENRPSSPYDIEYVFTKTLSPSSSIAIALELHKKIVPPRPYDIKLPLLWERLETKIVNGQQINFLSLEDTFIISALHIRRHTRRLHLKFIVDIAEELTMKIDWAYIRQTAKKNHISHTCYFALYIAEELFDTCIPNNALNMFKPGLLKQKLISLCMNKSNFLSPKKWQGIILRFLLFDTILDFIIYVWKVSFFERLASTKKQPQE